MIWVIAGILVSFAVSAVICIPDELFKKKGKK